MCGIAGIIGTAGQGLRDSMARMLESIAHRGPDGAGTLCLDDGILGHTRLAIVDLHSGDQPMSSAARAHHIVFNGEIYGYQELRKGLSDYSFRTTSDTEVILAAYAKYGEQLTDHLPGMFAFAIWDEQERKLILARDRFGEKPLYYACPAPGLIVFGSELKALLASGLVNPVVDQNAIAYYLRRHYIHPWRTVYKNVHALPPGHQLVWIDGSVTTTRYWRVPEVNWGETLDSAADRLQGLVQNAVASQLVADVEVGAFLSGGLDSTTIVGAAANLTPSIHTFCAYFDDQFSEAPYARSAAGKFGTRHTELHVGEYLISDVLQKLAYFYDEPFGDNSNVPTYLIAQKAREHLKVVLTGDGGDEIFGGYAWYRPLCWAEKNPRPSYWRWMAARILARTARTLQLPMGERLEERNIGIGMSRRGDSVLSSHVRQMSLCDDAVLEGFGLGDSIPEIDSWDQPMALGDGLPAAMNFDVQTFMAGDILTKVDRASMAHGLELRAPFLDVALAEFALSLPGNFRVTTNEEKRILRAAFSSMWPREIRSRRKQGFGAPVGQWLSSPELIDLCRETILNQQAPIFGYVDYEAARKRFNGGSPIQRWALLVLSLWGNAWLQPE